MQDIEALKPFALILFLLIVVATEPLYMRWRASAMRKFAAKHGFEYREGHHGFFTSREPPIPYTFRPRTYPANQLNQTWNVIQGELEGLQILILDGNLNLGQRRSRTTCTFIAAKAQISPFTDRDASEHSVLTNGWIALYRMSFFGQPKTMSIRRLENHLEKLTPSKIDLG